MKKAVIFDLDGTVLNTIEDLTQSVNYGLVSHGYHPRSVEDVLSFIGDGVFILLKRALPIGTSDEIISSCLASFKEHYDIHKEDFTIPYPGTLELLRKLKDNGYKLGVVSNKYHKAVNELCQVFNDYMSIYIGEGPGIPKKPDTTGLRVAMKFLKVTPNEVTYVGDSKNDYELAKNAGTSCVLVSWGYSSIDKLKQFNVPIASSNEELYEIIKNS